MVKKLVVVFAILLTALTFSKVIDEETARSFFSEALKEYYLGNFDKAYENSLKSLSGRVYLQELPYYWYLRGKLGIIQGFFEESIKQLNSYTDLVRQEDIENLKKTAFFFQDIKLNMGTNYDFSYVSKIEGKIRGIEYFYNPNSLSAYGDKFYITDPKNKRLVTVKSGKIVNIQTLKFEPKQVFANRYGEIFILDNNKLYNEKGEVLLENLRTPYIAGDDRDGRLYIANFDRITIFNPSDKMKIDKKLDTNIFVMDAEMTCDYLYILDGVRQRILVYDTQNLDFVKSINPPFKTWSIEVTPYDELIYLGEGKIYISGKTFDVSDVNFIEFSYPNIFLIKWKGNLVEHYYLKDENPIFIAIDKILFDDNYGYVYVRVEDFFGNNLNYVQNILKLYEQGVIVNSDISIENYDKKTVEVKSCTGLLISYRFKNLRTYGNCVPLNRYTGGGTKDPRSFYYVMRYKYIRPVPPGALKIDAKIDFKNGSYLDTMFYTEALIKDGQLRK